MKEGGKVNEIHSPGVYPDGQNAVVEDVVTGSFVVGVAVVLVSLEQKPHSSSGSSSGQYLVT